MAMDGAANKNVRFTGCKVIQLYCRSEGDVLAPLQLTVGGSCIYTKEDKKDFEIMMRTKQQSLKMHLPPNGKEDWPDYKAFETCPICCQRAKPGGNDKYWLLYHHLLQRTADGNIAVRAVTRLTCEVCFEELIEDEYVQCQMVGGVLGEDGSPFHNVPLLDAIESQGPITWMRETPPPRALSNRVLKAYELYQAWEYSGAWQVLSDNFGKMFQSLSDRGVTFMNEVKPDDPSQFWQLNQIPNKKGRQCDGPNCENVHGERLEPKEGERKGKKISLQECSGCFETMYCSEECQADAWPDHKDMCKEIQRERKEKDDQKKAQETLDREAKLEAARASFVPTNLTPQGGGGKKKKGKKSGGGKKKGKKK